RNPTPAHLPGARLRDNAFGNRHQDRRRGRTWRPSPRAELCAITRDAGEGCELSAWVEDRRRTTVDGLPAFLAGLAPRYRTFEPLTVSVLRVRAWASRLDPGCRNCALDPRACPGASSVHRHSPLQSGEV